MGGARAHRHRSKQERSNEENDHGNVIERLAYLSDKCRSAVNAGCWCEDSRVPVSWGGPKVEKVRSEHTKSELKSDTNHGEYNKKQEKN